VTAFEILGELVPLLRQAGIRFWIGGSIASSIWGDPRQTNDIDLAVLLPSLDEDKLRSLLPSQFYIGPTEVQEALAHQGGYPSFQILNIEEAFKFDVFLVSPTEYVTAEADRVREVELLPGQFFPIASAEDTILHKLRWYVIGGSISDRQWNDILQIMESQGARLDATYLNKWANHFNINQLLQKALFQALPPTT